ncbi:60S ribosomal protein L9-B, partial [Tolypocladium capitatum]
TCSPALELFPPTRFRQTIRDNLASRYLQHNTGRMKYIHSQELLDIPEGVKVGIKTRVVTVEGPRGKLVKDLSHVAVNFGHPKKNTISIEIHHGARKDVATLRTVRSLISNLIIGVTKGYKYKMRYVYAHFPINVNLDQNKETGLWEVEIRNFIGEKIVRRVTMAEGVEVEISKNQKDELILFGNSLENVSQSAADIQQICRVRNKDIRKFLDGLYVSEKGNVVEE